MTRMTTLLTLAFVLFFSSAVVARGGKQGGHGSHHGKHYNDRHYSNRGNHERYRGNHGRYQSRRGHHRHRHHNYARYDRYYRGPYARFEYHSPGVVIVYER